MLTKPKQFWADLRPYEKAGTVALLLGILIAMSFIGWLFYDGNIVFGGKIDLEKAGQAGSFIAGTSGVCWALAGVFFFISALRIQSEELKVQLDEMSQQKDIFKQQTFETTLFNILERIRTIQSKFEFIKVDPFLYWSTSCAKFSPDFYTWTEDEFDDAFPPGEVIHDEFLDQKIDNFLTVEIDTVIQGLRLSQYNIDSNLRLFYDNIFQAINMIEDYGIRKIFYLNLIFKSLNDYEIRFIFYWAYVTKEHSEEFEVLIRNQIPIEKSQLYSLEHSKMFPTVQ